MEINWAADDLLRLIINNIPVGIRFVSSGKKIIFANEVYARINGKNADDIIGADCSDYLSSGGCGTDRCALCLAGLHSSQEGPIEADIDGERRFFKFSATPLFDDDVLAGLLESFEEVTEHRRMELEIRRFNVELENLVAQKSLELHKTQDSLHAFLNAIPESALLIDENWTILAGNKTVAERVGRGQDDIIGMNALKLLPEDIAKKRAEMLTKALTSKQTVRFVDFRLGRYIENHIAPIVDEKGKVGRFAVLGIDVTDRIMAEEKIRMSEEKYRLLSESSSDFISVITGEDEVNYINEAGARLFGKDPKDVTGLPRRKAFPPEILYMQGEKFQKVFQDGREIASEEFFHHLGQTVWYSTIYVPLRVESGKVELVMCIGRDITKIKQVEMEMRQVNTEICNKNNLLKEMMEKLQGIAATDMLTGLASRRFIYERMEDEISRSKRNGNVFSLIITDIDDFKQINDVYGHLKGDNVLTKIGDIMQKNTRQHDIAARWGGEEFLIMLPETDLMGAYYFAEKLRATIQNTMFKANGDGVVSVTMTFGVVEHRVDETIESCLHRADDLLYQGKRSGKNIVAADVKI